MLEGVWKESLDQEKERRFTFTPWKNRQIQSILVIHQGALGDFILALPVLETLRKTFPQAHSIIIGYPRILELVNRRFYAEGVLSIDQKAMASFFNRKGHLDTSLSQFFGRFDIIVVFGRDKGGALTENLKWVCHGQILNISSFPSFGEKIHVTDHLLRQCSQYGFPILQLNPILYLEKSDQDWGEEFWKNRGLALDERSKVAILHPGSGSRKKVWPLERFLKLAQILQIRFSSKILTILGPAEGLEAEQIFKEVDPGKFIQVKGLSLLQLASVMKGCRLFIGNDSGVSHMASALGIPTVAIFGPTDPEVWSPRGEKVQVVYRKISCSPCTREELSQCTDNTCLKGIEIEDILKGLEKLGVET